MEVLDQYIILILITACLCVSYILDSSVTFISKRLIPFLIVFFAIGINIWVNMITITPNIIIGGITVGFASIGIYKTFQDL